MKCRLVVANGPRCGLKIPLKGDLYTIGSGPHCQLRVKDERAGSRHCSLERRSGMLFAHDLDSGFPTLVNGEKVPPGEEWHLHCGDTVRVANLELTVEFRERAAKVRDSEDWAVNCLEQFGRRRESVLDDWEERADAPQGGPSVSDIADAILNQLNAENGEVHGDYRIARQPDGSVHIRVSEARLTDEGEVKFLETWLSRDLKEPGLRVLIDFKDVRRMSCAAVAMLARLHGRLATSGGRLALCRMRPDQQELVRTFSELRRVPIFADRHAANKW